MALARIGQDALTAFYIRQAARFGSPVLVLGCGDGQLALTLAARGHEVVAVDPSPTMISAADERKQAGHRRASIRFLRADLRALRLDQRFSLVLAPQNALALMLNRADLTALLATVSHHLAPYGTFIFDVAARRPEAGVWPGRLDASESPRMMSSRAEPLGTAFTPHLREASHEPVRERGKRRGARAHRSIRRLRLRSFTSAELETALRESGLVAHERFGSFDGKPYDLEDALQIVVASADA